MPKISARSNLAAVERAREGSEVRETIKSTDQTLLNSRRLLPTHGLYKLCQPPILASETASGHAHKPC